MWWKSERSVDSLWYQRGVKLLTLPEPEYVIKNGQGGRTELVELFLAGGNATQSSLERKSVI
jgi:hypothetical protein